MAGGRVFSITISSVDCYAARLVSDLIRAQDIADIAGREDAELLAWSTENGRVLLTHDLATMVAVHLVRLDRKPESGCMPIVLVPDSIPIGTAIEDILLLDQCSEPNDWAAGVVYLPLR